MTPVTPHNSEASWLWQGEVHSSQGYLTKFKSTQNVQFCLRLSEKMAEQAEHTQVCEHCEGIFSLNLRQKWTLHGFHEAALTVPHHIQHFQMIGADSSFLTPYVNRAESPRSPR